MRGSADLLAVQAGEKVGRLEHQIESDRLVVLAVGTFAAGMRNSSTRVTYQCPTAVRFKVAL
jgi:hypothetical protein